MIDIVLCGDSYYDFDDRYPGLHWADQLDPYNVYRLAKGGSTNFLIWHQIQHVKHFEPDLVLISFTSSNRIEFPNNKYKQFDLSAAETNIDKQWMYRNTMYENVKTANPGYNKDTYINWMPYQIEEFEELKDSIYIKDSLDFLTKNNIPYLFTLGGYAGKIDLTEYDEYNILPNGWNHPDKLSDPWFHIRDTKWHQQHAEFIINHVG